MEEQKPKDLLEREIKKEIDDCYQEIKEEPLDEDDFKKEVSNSREVVDPWLQSNSSFFDMPNEEISNSSSQIIKQEPICSESSSVVAMDNVKMESIDELDDDLGSQMHLNHKIMKKPKKKPQNRRCSICSQSKPPKFLKGVGLVQDKIIIMVKLVLCGEYNLSDAQFFVAEKKLVPICYAHFPEVINKIFSVLRIQNIIKIYFCSPELMRNLMRTVNAICPQLTTSDFRKILRDSHRRNEHTFELVQKMEREEQESQNLTSNESKKSINTKCSKPQNYRCSVCVQSKPRNVIRTVKSEGTTFMIMIGCVLRGEYTIGEAQSLMSKKMPQRICQTHFPEAINKIFNVLRIQKLEEIHSYPTELMQNMMVTVNAICPKLSSSDFSKILSDFIRRNQNYLRMAKEIQSRIEQVKEQSTQFLPHLYLNNTQPIQEISNNEGTSSSSQNFIQFHSESISGLEVGDVKLESIVVDEDEEENDDITSELKISENNTTMIKYEKSRGETGSSEAKRNRCSVCARIKPYNEMREVASRENKLMITIGCVLRGDYTLKTAQSFMSQKTRIYICKIHFSHAIGEIYNTLDIKHYDEFATCSAEKMNSLMIIVSNLVPEFETWQFRNSFKKFVNSQKKLI